MEKETGAGVENSQSALRALHSELILIAEDSPIQAKLLERILLGAGYRVNVARDGAEGLAMAQRENPALIISDVNMPVMDGFEMSRTIRQTEALQHVPIILLTVLNDVQDVISGLNSGADSYVTKPYVAEYLLSCIGRLLAPFRPRAQAVGRRKLEVELHGVTYQISDFGSQHILNLLVSAYENAVLQNRELMNMQKALTALNEHLEGAVSERTASLNTEITERKGAEDRLHNIIENNIDGMLVVDGHGMIRFANAAAKDLLGRKEAQLLEQPFGLPLVTGKFTEIDLLRGGIPVAAEMHVTELRWEGDSAYLVSLHDITERKQAEQAILASEKRYRSLFDNMLDGFAHCRMLYENGQPRDFVYLDVNAAFEPLTGLKNVIGKKVSELIPGIRESNPELFEIYGRAAAGGKPEKFEAYIAALDMWLSISAYSAEQECFVAVFDNITERKRAADKLASRLDELERFRKATINREFRMHEINEENEKLKQRIEELGEKNAGGKKQTLFGKLFGG